MSKHTVYFKIVDALESGKLEEPFTCKEFRNACPGLAEGTYTVFLSKHRKGNPGGYSELFKRIDTGQYEVIRPFKYQEQSE